MRPRPSRLAVPVALMAAVVLAGCSGDGPGDTAADGPPTGVLPLAFAPEVRMPQLQGAGEPNIAVLPDGTLFVTAPVGGSLKPNVQEGKAYLWRSRDGGETWQALRSPDVDLPGETAAPDPGGLCSCDADVIASPDGWVYYSDWWAASVGNYLVEASPDGGQTWTVNPVPIPQNLLASMDRQWLVAGEDGFVGLFYSFFDPTPVHGVAPVDLPGLPFFGLDRPSRQLEAVFSDDHGATWSDPVTVVPAGDRYQIAHPRILPDGTLWMPYGAVPIRPDGDFWRDPSEVRIAVSTDGGATWDQRKVADAPEGFDNLWAVQGTTDPTTGRSYAVWAARFDDDHSGVFLSSSDGLDAWSTPYVVDGEGLNVLPWADARDGRLTVGWYGSAATGEPTEARPAAEWYALAAEWDASAAAGGAPTAATMPIAYVSLEPVKTGPMCPRGASCDGERELLDYVSMVYGPDGRVHYAFARSEEGAAIVHVATQIGYADQHWPDGHSG